MNASDLTTNIMSTATQNEMLPYDVFGSTPHITNGPEGENTYSEETGKYDLDTVSVFVAKLYQLLDGNEYKEYLTWNDTGDVFVICNMDDFAANVLPKFFKHCKFTSFVRQLNIYGFYRVSDARKSKHVRSKHACVFSHPQFRRGRQELLPNIRRKVAKTIRRRARTTESTPMLIDSLSASPDSYGSNLGFKTSLNSKGNNISSGGLSLSSLPRSHSTKDFSHSDRPENDNAMHDRINLLTMTTEKLRKEMNDMNRIISERLLSEVKHLAEGLNTHHNHLLALTQLVTAAYPDGDTIFREALRNFSKQSASVSDSAETAIHNQRAKRMRMDSEGNETSTTGTIIKSEQTPINSSPIPYGLYTTLSNPHGHSHYKNETIPSLQGQSNNSLITSNPSLETSTVSSSSLISQDPHHAFNNLAGPLITDYHSQLSSEQSPNHTHATLTGFSDSWNAPTVIMQDSVNSYNFLSATSNQSPILYSPSATHQQQSSQQSAQQQAQHSPQQQIQQQQQQPSPTPTIALSPAAAFVDGTNNANTNDLLSTTSTKTNEGHNSGGNSPHGQSQHHHREESMVGAPSPNSPVESPPAEDSSLQNFYQQPSIVSMTNMNMNMYGSHFGNYSSI